MKKTRRANTSSVTNCGQAPREGPRRVNSAPFNLNRGLGARYRPLNRAPLRPPPDPTPKPKRGAKPTPNSRYIVMVWRQHDLQHINTMADLLSSIVSDDDSRSKLFDRIIIGTKDDEKKRAQFCSTVRRPPRRKLTRRSPPLLARLSAGSPSITLRKKKGSGAEEGHAFKNVH